MEVICPPLVPDQVEGREAPHTHGITSTSSYVFANGDSGSGRSSTEPTNVDPSPSQSPSVNFDGRWSLFFGHLDHDSCLLAVIQLTATVECSVRLLLELAMVLICPGSSSIQGRRKRSQYCRFLSSVNSIGRFSYGGEEGISGVERLTNGDGEEELKRQSINKVEFTEI